MGCGVLDISKHDRTTLVAIDGIDGAGQPDPGSPEHRYAEGQRIYFRECDPRGAASIVIDNTDLSHPIVVKGSKG